MERDDWPGTGRKLKLARLPRRAELCLEIENVYRFLKITLWEVTQYPVYPKEQLDFSSKGYHNICGHGRQCITGVSLTSRRVVESLVDEPNRDVA
jgi:hypothetical protein